MMGQALFNWRFPVTKTSSALTAMTKEPGGDSCSFRLYPLWKMRKRLSEPCGSPDDDGRGRALRYRTFYRIKWYGMLRMRQLQCMCALRRDR